MSSASNNIVNYIMNNRRPTVDSSHSHIARRVSTIAKIIGISIALIVIVGLAIGVVDYQGSSFGLNESNELTKSPPIDNLSPPIDTLSPLLDNPAPSSSLRRVEEVEEPALAIETSKIDDPHHHYHLHLPEDGHDDERSSKYRHTKMKKIRRLQQSTKSRRDSTDEEKYDNEIVENKPSSSPPPIDNMEDLLSNFGGSDNDKEGILRHMVTKFITNFKNKDETLDNHQLQDEIKMLKSENEELKNQIKEMMDNKNGQLTSEKQDYITKGIDEVSVIGMMKSKTGKVTTKSKKTKSTKESPPDSPSGPDSPFGGLQRVIGLVMESSDGETTETFNCCDQGGSECMILLESSAFGLVDEQCVSYFSSFVIIILS